MVGHLDDRQGCGASELHVHVDGPHDVGRGQRPGHDLLREASTSQQACDYAETFEDGLYAGHCEQTHATDEAYWEDVWYWSTAREDCADEDSATTCVDYDAWVEAWTTLRGG